MKKNRDQSLRACLRLRGELAAAARRMLEASEVLQRLQLPLDDPEATRLVLLLASGVAMDRLEEARKTLQTMELKKPGRPARRRR